MPAPQTAQGFATLGDVGELLAMLLAGTDMAGNPLARVVRMNAGSVAPGQTLKTFTGTVSIASGATQPLETVTTGKTLYITDIVIGANTATQFLVRIQAAGVDIFDDYCKGDTGPIQAIGMESQPNAASGTVVQILFAAAAVTTASFFVAGWES